MTGCPGGLHRARRFGPPSPGSARLQRLPHSPQYGRASCRLERRPHSAMRAAQIGRRRLEWGRAGAG